MKKEKVIALLFIFLLYPLIDPISIVLSQPR